MTPPRFSRAHALPTLVLSLVLACESKPRADAKGDAKTDAKASTEPSEASEPEGLGLDAGQRWRLSLAGEGPLSGEWGGEVVSARRKDFDLSLKFEAEGASLVITLVEVPMGQTGRFEATPARFEVSEGELECSTALGGDIRVNLTHNTKDHVAGRIEGSSECKQSEGVRVDWSGAFDYAGDIEFQ